MTNKPIEQESSRIKWIIPLILAVLILMVCTFIFLYNHDLVYKKDIYGGYFFPGSRVLFYHICISLAALVVAVILKLICKHRVSLLLLLALAICAPCTCYAINYHAFEEDASLYPLTQEGGALHFITIHDFNFDGVDDGLDYMGNDIREKSYTERLVLPDDHISAYGYTLIGNGGNLDVSYCQYFEGSVSIVLHKSRVTYESLQIILWLQDGVDAENVSLYLFDQKLQTATGEDHSVTVTFDAETLKTWQRNATDERVCIKVECVVEESLP